MTQIKQIYTDEKSATIRTIRVNSVPSYYSTQMTQIKQIHTDKKIRDYPYNPRYQRPILLST